LVVLVVHYGDFDKEVLSMGLFGETVSFLAKRKKTKTRRPVEFTTSSGEDVSFRARRRPKRRNRIEFETGGSLF